MEHPPSADHSKASPPPPPLPDDTVEAWLRDDNSAVKTERQAVYGDPLNNHRGIAQMWAPLLGPWWERIRNGDPLPPHVIALLMGTLKIDRMRLTYHEDNYVDLSVYVGDFAKSWQADQKTYGPGPGPDPSR